LAGAPAIAAGQCRAIYAFDVGLGIDLAVCRRQLQATADAGAELARRRGSPSYFAYQPPPVRLHDSPLPTAAFLSTLPCDPKAVPAVRDGIAAEVTVTLFDFGAVSVEYAVPLNGPLEKLLTLSRALDSNVALQQDAQARVARLFERIRAHITRPELQPVVEDYVIFQVERFEPPVAVQTLLAEHGPTLARILRAEPGTLGTPEVEEALRNQLSYGLTDLVLIDWNSALVFDQDCEDTLSVLQFANVELLEMRWLDGQLNRSLDEAYQLLNEPRGRLSQLVQPYAESSHRVAMLQVDAAVLFENVNNAIKLVGDQYLARVYRRALERFHLAEWDADILRKLDVLGEIQQTLTNRASATRMEALEWIIILLIAAEILISFLRR
jgi:hypothetical protein